MKFLIGKKLGMTTLHEAEGALNVTLIECVPNTVSLVRTRERDGYAAVQLSAQKTKRRTAAKEFRSKAARAGDEEAAKALEGIEVGATFDVSVFAVGDKVVVTGVTKSKGFQGVVKRHGFKGQTTSHGRKHDIRKPGSIGATDAEHVFKGRRMAGRMGGENHTVRNLKVALVDPERKLIAVRGAVPGVAGRLVTLRGL